MECSSKTGGVFCYLYLFISALAIYQGSYALETFEQGDKIAAVYITYLVSDLPHAFVTVLEHLLSNFNLLSG